MQAESRACVTWWMPDFQWHPFGKLPRNRQLKPGLTTFTVTFAMRLIDVHTFQLHEFFGSQIPERYAILSRRTHGALPRSHFTSFNLPPDRCGRRTASKKSSTPATRPGRGGSPGPGSTRAASKNVHPTAKLYKKRCVCRRKRRSLTRSEPCQTVNGHKRGQGSPTKTGALNLDVGHF